MVKASFESAKNELLLRINYYKPIKHLHQNKSAVSDGEILPSEMTYLRHTAKAIKLLEKFAPWKPKCYNRALTTKNLLDKKGIHSNIHVGFRKKDGEFDGHAWITYKGKLVTGFIPDIHMFKELEAIV